MATKRVFYGQDNDRDYFERIFQSANINFLIGSGASLPAINVLGNIENELQELVNSENEVGYFDKATDFLHSVWAPHKYMLGLNNVAPFPPDFVKNVDIVRKNYSEFLSSLEKILNRRRTGLLPRRINIFTTNYDLFIEDAATSNNNIIFNDGFRKRINIFGNCIFDAGCFQQTVSATGNLYNYKVELPTINLIKLHGSLSWFKYNTDIIYGICGITDKTLNSNEEKKTWVLSHSLILPRKEKFKETVLQNIYYDLLRSYANELDKEATLLVVFGFSFADEHLEMLTKKALRNATLKMIIFSYSETSVQSYMDKFRDYSNVEVVYTPGKPLDFSALNYIITCYLGRI
ncbi:SIR2 family protein [Proteus terrae]|uniref:SIR2 family protein n=1 Tax=Proteus terrae TaxID=1574161 RepID=UPI0034D588E4